MSSESQTEFVRSALCYEMVSEGVSRCLLCPRGCVLKSGQVGFCGVRRGGLNGLETLNYGRVSACHLDPIEKKPLFHYKPGTSVLSVGGVGCTLHCRFCQNHHLLDPAYPTVYLSPERLVEEALKSENCSGIAFTYNEGSLFLEYIVDVAVLAHAVDLDIILVTNGYLTPAALKAMEGSVDAMNIDLKGYSERYYEVQCSGHMAPVLQAIERASHMAHIELTYLAVDPLNTKNSEFEACMTWLKDVDANIPLHISRYFPCYRLSLPETPLSVLYELKSIAQKSIYHVYVGNIPGSSSQIFCPSCKNHQKQVFKDQQDQKNSMTCQICGSKIYGVI